MSKALALGCLIAGVVLLLFGVNASESFSSEVSEFFTGNPTDKAMWLLISGAVLAAIGTGTLVLSRRT